MSISRGFDCFTFQILEHIYKWNTIHLVIWKCHALSSLTVLWPSGNVITMQESMAGVRVLFCLLCLVFCFVVNQADAAKKVSNFYFISPGSSYVLVCCVMKKIWYESRKSYIQLHRRSRITMNGYIVAYSLYFFVQVKTRLIHVLHRGHML
jgi:hypothetical protein